MATKRKVRLWTNIITLVSVLFSPFAISSPAGAWPKEWQIACEGVFGRIQNDRNEIFKKSGWIKLNGETVATTSGTVEPGKWAEVRWTPPTGSAGGVELYIELYKLVDTDGDGIPETKKVVDSLFKSGSIDCMPKVDMQLNISSVECADASTGSVLIHFVLVHVPDEASGDDNLYYNVTLPSGETVNRVAHFVKKTGSTVHFEDTIAGTGNGAYTINSGSVVVNGVTISLHNPGPFEIRGCELPPTPEPVCTVTNFVPFTLVNVVDDDTAAVQAWATWDQGPEEIRISWDFGGRTDTYRKGTPPIPPDPGWELERKGEPYTVTVTFIVEEAEKECLRQTVEVVIPARPEPSPAGSVTVDKIDESGQSWPGVTIELLEDGEVIATGTTPITFEGLELDDYVVREIVPEGSNPLGPTQFEFTLDTENLEVSFTFQNRRPAQCIVTDIKGALYYEGDHLSGNPVAGYVQNLSFDERCQQELYLEVFGSNQEPQSPDWLESQTHTAEYTIPVPPGTTEELGFTQLIDTDDYCWYQVDLTRVKTDSPYISGDAMVDYVFVKGTKPGCDPTGTVTVDKIDENEEPWTGVTIELLQDGSVIATGLTPVTFDELELGTYVVREIVPEGSEPIGPTQFEFTLDEENLSFEFTFQNRRPEEPPPSLACLDVSATIVMKDGQMIVSGTGSGVGIRWEVINLNTGEVMDSGTGSEALFEFVGAYKERYVLVFIDEEGNRSEGCAFEPRVLCPDCGPPQWETIPAGGVALKFYSVGECTVCTQTNTLRLEVWARLEGFVYFEVFYKGELLKAEMDESMAGDVWRLEFPFTWLEDRQDFSVWADYEKGLRIRDVAPFVKYTVCSDAPGFDDVTTDGVAKWQIGHQVADWVSFLLNEGYYPQTYEGAQDAYQWAYALRDSGINQLPELPGS